MKVHATLFSVNSKTGAPISWDFCENAAGIFYATNGWKVQHCNDIDDLRRTFARMSAYKTPSGAPRFSREPLMAAA